MKRYSIRRQVAWLTLVPSFFMVVGLGSAFLSSRFADMDKELLEHGKIFARQLASSSEYGVFSNNQEFLQTIANGILQQDDVNGLIILDSASEVLVSAGKFSSSVKKEFVGANVGGSQPVSAAERVDLLTPIRSNAQSHWIYQPIVPVQVSLDDFQTRSSSHQIGAVIVEMDRTRTEALKTKMLQWTLVTALIFLVFSLYLALLASRNITSPIRKLSEAVQAIGKGHLDTRISQHTHINELEILAQGINEMAAQLQQDRAGLQQKIDEATHVLRAKTEEAERASHDKSRFLAIASHDLRQPLHALGLYASELQRRVSNDEQRQLLGRMEYSIEALSTLLNALLDISKLDAGVIIPQLQACDINAMLGDIVAGHQMLAGIKNVRLITRPCSRARFVTSDPLLLERILVNLVSNAIRYSYPKGCVLIACRLRKGFLRIEVRDNGVGISKNDQENIFREFYQLAQPHLDASKGLGLGLAIVDRLVKLLGHRIELRSRPARGSVFALEVPIDRRPASRVAAETARDSFSEEVRDAEPSTLQGKKFLVVDDDAPVLSGTADMLASWGCKVDTATSLEQVEQLLRNGMTWDFIVSDYQLENEVSGIDVIAMVRGHANRQIPCILISGDTSPALLKLASINGHQLLHKPVRPAKLRSLIIYELEKSGAASG